MSSQQLTCVHGQCSDASCGFDFVFVGTNRIPADVIIRNLETGAGEYWTILDGDSVPVVVHIDPATGRSVITTAVNQPKA